MKLLGLYASNFKKLKLKQPISFPEGIILITGLNESGKSTVLDAILFALYGRMIRPSQKPSDEEIISYGSGKAEVRLDFSVRETKYRIVREVHKSRPNTARLYEVKSDGSTRAIATTVNETTNEVERLLGKVTYNELVASSVVAQKDLERLIRQRLDDRRKVVNVFLNLDSFNKVQDELNEKRLRLEGTPKNPGQLVKERQILELLSKQELEYANQSAQLSTIRETLGRRERELRDLNKTFENTDQLYRTLNEYKEDSDRKASFEKEIEGKKALEENLNRQLTSLSSIRTELGSVLDQIASYNGIEDDEAYVQKANRELDTLRELEFTLAPLLETEKQMQADIGERRGGLPAVGSSTITKQSPSKAWQFLAATGAMGAGAILSFFLSLFLAAVILGSAAVVSLILLARQIASLSQAAEASSQEQKIRANEELVRSKEKELLDLNKRVSDVRNQIAQKTREINGLPSVIRYSGKLEHLETPRELLEKANALLNHDKQTKNVLEEKFKLLERQLSDEPDLQKRLSSAREELQATKEKLARINLPALPEGIVFDEDVLSEAASYRDSLNESVSRVRTQIEESKARQLEVNKFLEENRDLAEKVQTQERKVGLLENDLAVAKYSIRGIEQTSESLRNRVRPQVERYMGVILPVITLGRYKAVQLDDDYTVRIFDPEAGEFKPKEVFSGGTEDQFLLAMRLAFALALMPQAKGQSPEFLFLDEPLGSSDRLRREGILELLRKELSQNFGQIFLVSHVGDLETEADTIIEMENGTVREITTRKSASHKVVEVAA